VLHNISGSVDLLPRRDDMVSVNSDCLSGSAASSEIYPMSSGSHSEQKSTSLTYIL
jgi:hypothetical protein